jgi:hypothetical protein
MHPRDWDGCRLLQFLAGLALLALSFLAPPAPAVAAPPAPAVVVVEAAAPEAASDATPAVEVASPIIEVRAADRTDPCWHVGTAHVIVMVAAGTVPAGVSPAAHGSRGPPLH